VYSDEISTEIQKLKIKNCPYKHLNEAEEVNTKSSKGLYQQHSNYNIVT
jgi:hypothetical protein